MPQLPNAFMRILYYGARYFQTTTFVLFAVVALFLQASRRMNAHADAAAIPRLPLRWAQALLAKDNLTHPGRQLTRLLLWIDNLLWLKLKLLPDVRTGRRLNFITMLFGAWLISRGYVWYMDIEALSLYEAGRKAQPGIWLFLSILFVFMLLMPFLLARKNRELYFDVIALFVLMLMAANKLFFCVRVGCCYGIPWPWGVYSNALETTVFPTQLFEFAVGALLSLFCILYMLYGKTYQPGRGCSFCLLSYVLPRFFWDFLRYRGEDYRASEANLYFGLTVVQIACLICVVLAIVWLFILPIEKRLMDRLGRFVLNQLRKVKWLAHLLEPAAQKREEDQFHGGHE